MSDFSARQAGIEYPEGKVSAVVTPEIVDPARKLVKGELVDWIQRVDPGTFSFDRNFLPGLSEEAQTAQFIELPEHAKTREESYAHNVKFGQLLLHARDDAEQALYVAIKPFRSPLQAAYEYAVASYFASGRVPGVTTYRPLGIYRLKSSEDQYGVVSNYRHSVRSLDNVFWNPELIKDPRVISKALGRGALTLGTLHTHGWIHGDPQVKNIAWDILQPSNGTFLIDVEETRPFPATHGRTDMFASANKIREDIRWFLKTAQYRERYSDDYLELIKRDFCISYVGMTALHGKNVLGAPGVYPDYEEIVEILQSEREKLQEQQAS